MTIQISNASTKHCNYKITQLLSGGISTCNYSSIHHMYSLFTWCHEQIPIIIIKKKLIFNFLFCFNNRSGTQISQSHIYKKNNNILARSIYFFYYINVRMFFFLLFLSIRSLFCHRTLLHHKSYFYSALLSIYSYIMYIVYFPVLITTLHKLFFNWTKNYIVYYYLTQQNKSYIWGEGGETFSELLFI